MNSQLRDTTIFETSKDAIKSAVYHSGKTFKEVAAAVWPSKSVDAAHTLLLSCLNNDRKEKLELEEIIFICNYCNQYEPLYYFSTRCRHETPEKKTEIEEFNDLKKNFAGFQENIVGNLKLMEKLLKNYASFQDAQSPSNVTRFDTKKSV